MVERTQEAFSLHECLTVVGKMLQPGDAAPDFSLDYLDLIDLKVHRAHLDDSAGMVRLLSIVNSLDLQTCHRETLQWEQRCAGLPCGACIYTVSMDLPYAQARWQSANGVIHQTLSAWRNERFGLDYGILLKEWRLLQRSVFVIDSTNRIAYAEYIADQTSEPDYEAALAVIRQVTRIRHAVPAKDRWMQKSTQPSSTSPELTPDVVSIPEFEAHCMNELNSKRHEHSCEDSSCLKLLLFARLHQHQQAWDALARCLGPVARNGLLRHPRREEALRIKSEEHYLNLAFTEFRRITIEQNIEFPTLADALRCLLVCLSAVIQDALRASSSPQPTTANATVLMATIQQFLPEPRERRLAYLLFHCGLAPKQIIQTCPQEFSDIQELYHLRRTIMQRLVRHLEPTNHPLTLP